MDHERPVVAFVSPFTIAHGEWHRECGERPLLEHVFE
jgi:hypothetical protein